MINISEMNSRNLSLSVLCILTAVLPCNGARNIVRRRRSGGPKHNYFVRCTRRFTPGLCIEPVEPVWTFVFQLQNCTERYGCPQDWRTNRFTSHARCMRRCKPLVDIYTETLERGAQNVSAYLRSQAWNRSGRRYSGDDEDGTDVKDEGDTPIEHPNGPNVLDSSDDRDHKDWVAMAGADDVDAIASDGLALDDHDCIHD